VQDRKHPHSHTHDEDAESIAIQKALGDEHHYGNDPDPAADNTVDSRLIIRHPPDTAEPNYAADATDASRADDVSESND
jgi:hypothetical protein